MAEHPIQGLMNVTMDKIHQMVDSNTIIGKPITTEDGTTILPVSKVSFGFASGGTDFDGKNAANKDLFGGGSGAGVNIQPVAFLVVKDGCVRTIQLSDGSNTVDRALTMIAELVEKVSAPCEKDEPAAPKRRSDSRPPTHRRNCKLPTRSFFSACPGSALLSAGRRTRSFIMAEERIQKIMAEQGCAPAAPPNRSLPRAASRSTDTPSRWATRWTPTGTCCMWTTSASISRRTSSSTIWPCTSPAAM